MVKLMIFDIKIFIVVIRYACKTHRRSQVYFLLTVSQKSIHRSSSCQYLNSEHQHAHVPPRNHVWIPDQEGFRQWYSGIQPDITRTSKLDMVTFYSTPRI